VVHRVFLYVVCFGWALFLGCFCIAPFVSRKLCAAHFVLESCIQHFLFLEALYSTAIHEAMIGMRNGCTMIERAAQLGFHRNVKNAQLIDKY
jgi:hypothetical protein